MRACQSFVKKLIFCSICNENGGREFNSNARTVQELPRAMCVTTKPGHTPQKHEHSTQRSNIGATIFEMCNPNQSLTILFNICLTPQPGPKQTNEQSMSKTHRYGRHPRWPLLGQHALKNTAYCPNTGTFGLRHSCSGSSKLPSSRRVTLFNEPSTRTSNAAITWG